MASGNNNRGEFARTLVFVDVETGIIKIRACLSAKTPRINSCISQNIKNFPYKIKYANTDNGSEFINHIVQKNICQT